eukprot:CAMPEP_0116044824 /NCGR_PEP_ID=MMETSP0321-20121206/27242_1 /TAXON_ID=163516 /ORGANISM="Leptocylindrus danicus var. danicus, Strain B650" /LENGTH=192 /DNA_ID=CAMNT_0003526019 /DNA_START=263 /DNA_END=841 /DNA_ORIENTATION=+
MTMKWKIFRTGLLATAMCALCDGLTVSMKCENCGSRRSFLAKAGASLSATFVMGNRHNSDGRYGPQSASAAIYSSQESAINAIATQNQYTKAYAEKNGLAANTEFVPLEPGTPSFRAATKIMEKFNISMDEYVAGSWEAIRLEDDSKAFWKVKDPEVSRDFRSQVRRRIPRKIAVELSNEISQLIRPNSSKQ